MSSSGPCLARLPGPHPKFGLSPPHFCWGSLLAFHNLFCTLFRSPRSWRLLWCGWVSAHASCLRFPGVCGPWKLWNVFLSNLFGSVPWPRSLLPFPPRMVCNFSHALPVVCLRMRLLGVFPVCLFDTEWLPFHHWFGHCQCMHPQWGSMACPFWGIQWLVRNTRPLWVSWMLWDTPLAVVVHFSTWFPCLWACAVALQSLQSFWHVLWKNCRGPWTAWLGALFVVAGHLWQLLVCLFQGECLVG